MLEIKVTPPVYISVLRMSTDLICTLNYLCEGNMGRIHLQEHGVYMKGKYKSNVIAMPCSWPYCVSALEEPQNGGTILMWRFVWYIVIDCNSDLS